MMNIANISVIRGIGATGAEGRPGSQGNMGMTGATGPRGATGASASLNELTAPAVTPVCDTGSLTYFATPTAATPRSTYDCQILKNGNFVTVRLPSWRGQQTGSPTNLTMPGLIPIGYRPYSGDQGFISYSYTLWNNGIPAAGAQTIYVFTNGDVRFYSNGSFGGAFGCFIPVTITYCVI